MYFLTTKLFAVWQTYLSHYFYITVVVIIVWDSDIQQVKYLFLEGVSDKWIEIGIC